MRARLALGVVALAALICATQAARDSGAGAFGRRLQAVVPLYRVKWSKVANAAAFDIAVDTSSSRAGDVWAVTGVSGTVKPMATKCTGQAYPSGASCGYELTKLNTKIGRFQAQPNIKGCGKRLTIMPSTGKPWLLDNCSNVKGWLANNAVMTSPQSLANSYTFRDITAVNSTVMMQDGNVSVVPNPNFYTVDTQYNRALVYAVGAGMSYPMSSTWAASGKTLLQLTMEMGSMVGGMGPWYIPYPQYQQLGKGMASWAQGKAKPANKAGRSNFVFLDGVVDANDIIWVTGGVLGASTADSAVAVWYWDNNAAKFVRVWDQSGVIPGRIAIGPSGTVYVTAGVWNSKGNVTTNCNLDSTEGEEVFNALGPLGKCFQPRSVWKGVITQRPGPVKAQAASADKVPAASALVGEYQGVPVEDAFEISPVSPKL